VPGRRAVSIELGDDERAEFEARAWRRKTSPADAMRASIVLLPVIAVQGRSSNPILTLLAAAPGGSTGAGSVTPYSRVPCSNSAPKPSSCCPFSSRHYHPALLSWSFWRAPCTVLRSEALVAAGPGL